MGPSEGGVTCTTALVTSPCHQSCIQDHSEAQCTKSPSLLGHSARQGLPSYPRAFDPHIWNIPIFSAMGDRSWQRPTFLRLSNQLSRWPDEEPEPELALTCQREATRQAGGMERPGALSTSGLENARLWEKSEASRGLPARLFLGV